MSGENRKEWVGDMDINSMYWGNISPLMDFDGDTQSIKIAHNKPYPEALHAESNIIYRSNRVPDRQVFYVDVGGDNKTPEETAQYLEDIKKAVKAYKFDLNSEYGKTGGYKKGEMTILSSLDKPAAELSPLANMPKGKMVMDEAYYYAPYIPLALKDYKVTCDETNNPPESIEAGTLNIDITIQPVPVPNRIINPGMWAWTREVSSEDTVQHGIDVEAEIHAALSASIVAELDAQYTKELLDAMNGPLFVSEELDELRADFGIEIDEEEPIEVLPTTFSRKRVIEDGDVEGFPQTHQTHARTFAGFTKRDQGQANER